MKNTTDQEHAALIRRIDELEQQVTAGEQRLEAQQNLMHSLLSALPLGVFWKDRNSVFQGGNQVFIDAVGLNSSSALVGKTDHDMPYAGRADEYVARDREVMESGVAILNTVETLIKEDEAPTRWLELNKIPLRDVAGEVFGIVGTFMDVTQRERDSVTLKRQLATIEATVDAIAFVENGLIKYANPAWCVLYGYTGLADVHNTTWHSCYPDDEIERLTSTVEPILAAQGSWRGEVRALRRDGTTFDQGVSLSPTDDGALICICRDVSELKAAQDEIERNALHDELTGLPNRRLLIERVEMSIRDSQRNPKRNFALLFLDLDRFKIVNDSLGHAAGDQLLVQVADKLRSERRASDLIARIGGDEFVVVLNDIDGPDSVARITAKIIDTLKTPTTIEGREIFCGASVGVVMSNARYKTADEILRDADIAMYRAKRDVGAAFKFFDEVMFHQVRERLTIETDLRKAVKAEELAVHYQPIINLNTGRIEGCEALVRWPHAERGMVRPDLFVPIAEEAGMIGALDNWVMRTACQQLAVWQHALPGADKLKVNVNVSTTELRHENLVRLVEQNLQRSGVSGSSLCLELTERVLVEDFDTTVSVLSQLAAMNVRVSIDDFGTGYSSFSYLHKLPVNNLKIDRSFIGQMDENQNSFKVASIIIALSDQLGLNVVAEGIETPRQLQLLQELGCEYGQGYYFSKPLAAPDFEDLMREQEGCVRLLPPIASTG